MWAGFVESRLRKLVSDLLARSLPIKKIQLWPKKFEACVADRSALLTVAQRQNCLTYFIGFQVDKLRMRGNQLNVEIPLQNFRDWDLSRFTSLSPGMDVLVKSFKVKELPKICFEGMYEGGKVEAMKKRRQLREADPVRQEKKQLARLEELRTKMAEMQRKKQEQQDRKRKRDEVDVEEEKEAAEEAVKVAQQAEDTAVEGETEETDLLESALDTIQETGEAKTREEAEADRLKLLSGEFNDEGEEGVDEYESDEDAVGYAGEGARQGVYLHETKKEEKHRNKMSLPVSEEDAEILKKLGYAIGDVDEQLLGMNMLPPWRLDSPSVTTTDTPRVTIKFRGKFEGLVELDANGHVIDKGDDDFEPSSKWAGRKAGFEFKLGPRGLGYYRTGKQVVVPSNTAY
jgi:hypothetical protein